MPDKEPIFRVRIRALFEFVYHVVGSVFRFIGKILWEIFWALFSLLP